MEKTEEEQEPHGTAQNEVVEIEQVFKWDCKEEKVLERQSKKLMEKPCVT